ncbi:uncharacterized protein NPIL_610141 [Nephila pilipes]|uniref:Essential protein Yae1 N-terminal domain-containing protein n=1 Tax=Nephila pilipes TaxID=299642 RepID=A0A8X6NFA9_NEPPI|nr:uncharacterized protein NPIL_307281 [Nephila pilipes]GFT10293.1 uncharacterized protein NPIL_610141 [Nephila pilipes]
MESDIGHEVIEPDCENAFTVEEIEWKKLKNHRLKEGYSDGICVGSEIAKESGEEHGYVKGFEDTFNYELSIAMGLLGVNQCILRNIKSPLLPRAKEIKSSLDNFRRNYNTVRMTNLDLSNDGKQEENNHDVATGIHDENSNVPLVSTKKGYPMHISNRRNDATEDLYKLKLKILDFLTECHQPLILDQMRQIFENLNHLLMQSSVCSLETPESSSNEETLKSR